MRKSGGRKEKRKRSNVEGRVGVSYEIGDERKGAPCCPRARAEKKKKGKKHDEDRFPSLSLFASPPCAREDESGLPSLLPPFTRDIQRAFGAIQVPSPTKCKPIDIIWALAPKADRKRRNCGVGEEGERICSLSLSSLSSLFSVTVSTTRKIKMEKRLLSLRPIAAFRLFDHDQMPQVGPAPPLGGAGGERERRERGGSGTGSEKV